MDTITINELGVMEKVFVRFSFIFVVSWISAILAATFNEMGLFAIFTLICIFCVLKMIITKPLIERDKRVV